MISKSTKTKAEKERMKNIFEPIFMDNAMKYFETGLPCCFGDINIDGKDFGVFGLIVWSDDKIVGVEAFVGGMEVVAGGKMRHGTGYFHIVEIDGVGVAKLGKHGLSADGHPHPPKKSGTFLIIMGKLNAITGKKGYTRRTTKR